MIAEAFRQLLTTRVGVLDTIFRVAESDSTQSDPSNSTPRRVPPNNSTRSSDVTAPFVNRIFRVSRQCHVNSQYRLTTVGS